MRKFKLLYVIHLIFIIPAFGQGQSRDNIEFSFFNTHNTQAKYDAQFGNVSYTNHLVLYGTDRGFKIDYKRLLYGKTFFKIGLGYLDFAVNKIDNQTALGNTAIKTDARPINYPSSIFILYATTKYHYNDFLYHLGIERQFGILHDLSIIAGLDYFHATSISQKYYIPKAQTYYNTNNQGNFGNFFNLNLGVCEKLGSLSFSPALVLPVYKNWRQDIVFNENPAHTISSWGSGIGISLSVSYH